MDGSAVSVKATKNVCPSIAHVMAILTAMTAQTKEDSAVSSINIKFNLDIVIYFAHFLDSTTNCSKITQCPDGCYKTPTGPVCSCSTGFQLRGKECVGKMS